MRASDWVSLMIVDNICQSFVKIPKGFTSLIQFALDCFECDDITRFAERVKNSNLLSIFPTLPKAGTKGRYTIRSATISSIYFPSWTIELRREKALVGWAPFTKQREARK